MAEQRFMVKAKSSGRWVSSIAIRVDCVAYEYTNDRGWAAVFGPELRPFFEARVDEYEIVPEFPPFVLPPTPWARSERGSVVDANGVSVVTRGHSDRHVGLVHDEIIRRVNWHEKAEKALREIKGLTHGSRTQIARDIAAYALAELPEGPTP